MTIDTESPRTRRPIKAVVFVTVAVTVLLVAGSVWLAGGDDEVPYHDAQSSGLLTLCDAKGKAVTGGKISDKPFAAYAVGETALDDRVGPDAGPVATLYGYQPREGVDSLEFSGTAMGGPVAFSNRDRPATRIVEDAYSIANFVEIYPATFDGYVQLRLITSASGFGAFTNAYDTADIKIDGDNWKVVRGGKASCTDAASLLTHG